MDNVKNFLKYYKIKMSFEKQQILSSQQHFIYSLFHYFLLDNKEKFKYLKIFFVSDRFKCSMYFIFTVFYI